MTMRYIPGSGVDPTPYTSKVPNYDVFGPMSAAFDTLFAHQLEKKKLAEQARQADMSNARAGEQNAMQAAHYGAQAANNTRTADWGRAQEIAKILAAYSSAVSAGSPDAAAAAKAQLERLGASPEDIAAAGDAAPRPSTGAYQPPPKLGEARSAAGWQSATPPPQAPSTATTPAQPPPTLGAPMAPAPPVLDAFPEPPPGTPPAGDNLGVTKGRMPRPGATLESAEPLAPPSYGAGAPPAQLGGGLPPPSAAGTPAAPAAPSQQLSPPAQLGGPLQPPADPGTSAGNTVYAEVQRAALAAGLSQKDADAIAQTAASEAFSTTALDGKPGVSSGDRVKRGMDRGVELIKATLGPQTQYVLQGERFKQQNDMFEKQAALKRELSTQHIDFAAGKMAENVDKGLRSEARGIVDSQAKMLDLKKVNDLVRTARWTQDALTSGNRGDRYAIVQMIRNINGGGVLTDQDMTRWHEFLGKLSVERGEQYVMDMTTGKLSDDMISEFLNFTEQSIAGAESLAADAKGRLAEAISVNFSSYPPEKQKALMAIAMSYAGSLYTPGPASPGAPAPAAAPQRPSAAPAPAPSGAPFNPATDGF